MEQGRGEYKNMTNVGRREDGSQTNRHNVLVMSGHETSQWDNPKKTDYFAVYTFTWAHNLGF